MDQAGAASSGHVDGNILLPTVRDGWPVFPSVRDRYYTAYKTSNHQTLHVHSNGICVLGVDPTHPQLQPPNQIASIVYRDHAGKSLLHTEVRGKKKTGASFVAPNEKIAVVTLSDGSSFSLFACVRGNVIEINSRLVDNPQLLTDVHGAGYFAVLLPKADEKGTIGQACLDFDREHPLGESGNAKRRLEGKAVRSARKKAKPLRVCWDFQRSGSCKFGDKCRFAHGVDDAAGGGGDCPPAGERATQPEQVPPSECDGGGEVGVEGVVDGT